MKNIFSNKNITLLLFLLLISNTLFVRSGDYAYLVSYSLYLVLFINYRPVLSTIFVKFFGVQIFLTIYGIARGNEFISVAQDFIHFSPCMLLLFNNKKINSDLTDCLPRYLANSLILLIPLSISIFRFMGYAPGGMDIARLNYDTSIKINMFAPMVPIVFAPFLIFFLEKLNIKQKLLVHLSIMLITIFGVMTLTRSIILSAILPYILCFVYELFHNFRLVKLFKISIALVFISVLMFEFDVISKIGLTDSVSGTIERQKQSERNNDISTQRFQEVEDYLKQDLDFFEIFFGRGMGGHKVRNDDDAYIGGPNMMHIGPAMVFLKGGILLVLLLYLPALRVIFYFWKTPYFNVSLITIYFMITDFQMAGWWYLGFSTFFYWYGIYIYDFARIKEICGRTQVLPTH